MTIFKLPDLGEGLPDAEISAWHIKVGDHVTVDQNIVSMETAKAIVEVPSPFTGKIKKLYGNVGDVIQTGKPLVEFESDEATASAGSEKKSESKGTENKEETAARTSEPDSRENAATVAGKLQVGNTILKESPTGISIQRTSSGLKATPAIRALAQRLNVDLTQVHPTGPNGSISSQDVEKAAEHLSRAGGLELLKGVRRIMSQVMSKSHSEVVPVTVVEDAKLYQWKEKQDITVRIIQAIVAAVKKEPALNVWFDGKAQGRRLVQNVNIGLATDTEDGLFVPVIREVETKDANTLRQEVDKFKKSVGDRSVSPEDFLGGTIILTNFGKFAGRYASPIIVPPMVAALAVGRLREEIIAIDGQPKVSFILPLSLSFDHRAVTGGEATRFLGAVIEALEKSE